MMGHIYIWCGTMIACIYLSILLPIKHQRYLRPRRMGPGLISATALKSTVARLDYLGTVPSQPFMCKLKGYLNYS